MTVHPSAAAFSGVAATYERGRPEYPAALRTWLSESGDLRPGGVVCDLGAGTGKLTRLFVGHGARVIAVEPLPEMLSELEAVVPQAEALRGSAERIPLPDASADLVSCGQSFHWFANVAALVEIARVLRPGGALVLVWNVRDRSDPLQLALGALLDRESGATPSYGSGAWREVMTVAADFFADGTLDTASEQLVDRAGLIDRAESTSYVAALTGAARQALLAEVSALAPPTGRVALKYRTLAYRYRRRGGNEHP